MASIDHGPGSYGTPRRAYLFQCGETDLFAVSLDPVGANLPAPTDGDRWLLRTEFALGVHEPVPFPIDPEPILRGVRANGYYLWRDANTSKTHATGQ